MQKQKAIELLGGTVATAAEAIGISYQAVKQWPDELPPRIADRVYAVWGRKNMPAPDQPTSPTPVVVEDQAVIVAVLVAAPKVESAQQPDHRAIPTRRTEIPSPYNHSDIDRRDEEVRSRRAANGEAVDVAVKGD